MESLGEMFNQSSAASSSFHFFHIVSELQGEILLFLLAIAMHQLFISRRTPRLSPKKKAPSPSQEPEACGDRLGAPSSPTHSRPQRQAEATGDAVTQLVQDIRRFAGEGQLGSALRLFQSQPARSYAAALVGPMLEACVKCEDAAQARAFLSRAQRMGYAGMWEYSSVIRLHLGEGNYIVGRQLFDEMLRYKLRPSATLYNELLAAAALHFKRPALWQHIGRLLDEMTEAQGLSPSRGTCALLLKLLERQTPLHLTTRVMAIFDNMDEGVDEALVAMCVEASMRVEQWPLVKERLALVHQKYLQQVSTATTFGIIIKAHGFVRDVDGAWRCWQDLVSKHVRPSSVAIGCMVEAVVSNGDPTRGHELIRSLLSDAETKKAINSVIYGSVLKGYSRKRELQKMWEVYREMQAHDIQPSAVTFNLLIDACTRNSELGTVPWLMSEMRDRGFEPNLITYSTVVKGHCAAGDIPAAIAVLEDLQKHPILKLDEIFYNQLLDGCAQHGYAKEGEKIFREMIAAGIAPTSYGLSRMVRILGHSRRLEDAFRVVADAETRFGIGKNVHIYGALIHACLASRDVARALRLLDSMLQDGCQPDARLVQNLILAALNAGMSEQAVAVLGKLPAAASTLMKDEHFLDKMFGYMLRCDDAPPLARRLAAEARSQNPGRKLECLATHGL